jgi:hypothetical protein
MNTPNWLRPDVSYIRRLAEAGLDGVTSAWNAPCDRTVVSNASNAVWLTAAAGGLVGGISALMMGRRKSGYKTAFGVLVGGATGYGSGLAWKSRVFPTTIGRSVMRRVNAVRDERWLEKNPIDYA